MNMVFQENAARVFLDLSLRRLLIKFLRSFLVIPSGSPDSMTHESMSFSALRA